MSAVGQAVSRTDQALPEGSSSNSIPVGWELAWEQCLSQLSEEDLQSLKAWQKAGVNIQVNMPPDRDCAGTA